MFSAVLGFTISCFDDGKASRTDAHVADETIVVGETPDKTDACLVGNDVIKDTGSDVNGTVFKPIISADTNDIELTKVDQSKHSILEESCHEEINSTNDQNETSKFIT